MPPISRQRLYELESTTHDLRASLDELKARVDELAPRKKEVSPLLLAALAGIVTLVGGVITGIFAVVSNANQARDSLALEKYRQTEAHQLATEKQQQDHDLESDKLRTSLILKLTEVADATQRKESLLFYAKLGFLGPGMEEKIKDTDAADIPQAPSVYESEKTYKSGSRARVNGVIVFQCGLVISAGGAPTAYAPALGKGLDALVNAGSRGNWYGLVTDASGQPVVQGPNDPAPGYYVSTTTLQDESKALTDPRRYVDSTAIPYIVIPHDAKPEPGEPHIGDVAAVYCEQSGKLACAVIADFGPRTEIGEGSIALAEKLGLKSNPMSGGVVRGIKMALFPGSGKPWPMTVADIEQIGKARLESWGGLEKLKTTELSFGGPQSSGGGW